ncbi:PepSY domain-containing protein [Alicyclobacillus ferrooxydans]|uniref:PepSY domain-containing protein n=1 Tax=Alicyclobacillus ferrooxydans TaxID=471514 RepID=UPI000AAECEED|nr:PepSY domain-containing protein [Alicyclobacillus ferrooxydans]
MKWKSALFAAATACSLSLVMPTVWAADDLQRSGIAPNQPSDTTTASSVSPAYIMDAPEEHGENREFNIRSSVQVSREALRDAYVASRTAYTDKLKKYAKCSQADATKAITAAHPGMKVSHVQLRNIRTSLVYVGVAEDDEDRYLCVVDAGNGKLLLDKPLPTHHERVFADSK